MVRPLIGLYAESGCGKTMSALLLARGLVGPGGKICMIDTESGRGQLYADVIPGGYDVLTLGEPFGPDRYIAAMAEVEKGGYGVGIIDSGSHEWEGIGGVLDQASAIEERTGKPGLHCWKSPKLAHQKWMLKLLQSPIPWIVCLRAKHKSRQTKENGKTVIVKDEFTSPTQAEDFIFELIAHAEILQDHSIRLTKCSHPDLRACWPTSGPITVSTGNAIARWCKGSAEPVRNIPPELKASPSKLRESPDQRRVRWIKLCRQAGGGKDTYAYDLFLEMGILTDTQTLDDFPAEKLPKTKQESDNILATISANAGLDDVPTP